MIVTLTFLTQDWTYNREKLKKMYHVQKAEYIIFASYTLCYQECAFINT